MVHDTMFNSAGAGVVMPVLEGQIQGAFNEMMEEALRGLREAWNIYHSPKPQPITSKGYVRPNMNSQQWRERYGDPEELEEPAEEEPQVFITRRRKRG